MFKTKPICSSSLVPRRLYLVGKKIETNPILVEPNLAKLFDDK